MASIEWRDEFSIKVEEIDRQHRELFEMIGQLESNIPDGVIDKNNDGPLVSLMKHFRSHFEHEEKLMQEVEYSDYESHRGLHAEFRQHHVKVLFDLKKGKKITVSEVQSFLGDWLTDHILKEDKELGMVASSKSGSAP